MQIEAEVFFSSSHTRNYYIKANDNSALLRKWALFISHLPGAIWQRSPGFTLLPLARNCTSKHSLEALTEALVRMETEATDWKTA